MKKALIIAAALLLCAGAAAQSDAASFRNRYESQVRVVGAGGLGVEGILDRWEAAFPEDPAVWEARYKFWMAKSLSTEVVAKPQAKYLGNDPVLTLKDTTGRDIRYFEVNVFADSLFSNAVTAIDRAVELAPEDIAYRIDKITALMLYENESPDMAKSELLGLIEYNRTRKPAWTYYGQPLGEGVFDSTVQEYCWNFFRMGTTGSYEAFREVSETMLKINPKDVAFMNNLGSYYLVAKGNSKKAIKWYNKVLKIAPGDYNAAKNCVVLARKDKNVKLEKKYLPLLIKATDSDSERMAAQARLDSMNAEKK